MWAVLALRTTVLTSVLPILNKQLLRDARPALVAWAINTFSLPLLAVGTFLLTQCTVEGLPGRVSLLHRTLATDRYSFCCRTPGFSRTQLGSPPALYVCVVSGRCFGGSDEPKKIYHRCAFGALPANNSRTSPSFTRWKKARCEYAVLQTRE